MCIRNNIRMKPYCGASSCSGGVWKILLFMAFFRLCPGVLQRRMAKLFIRMCVMLLFATEPFFARLAHDDHYF